MIASRTWRIGPTKMLSRRELAAVLNDLARKAPRSLNTRMNLVIVRLACCCGLRVSEIGALRIEDVVVGVERPHLVIPRSAAKGGRGRVVPLWWDAGTLRDLAAWKELRQRQDAAPDERFVCSMQAHLLGRPLTRQALRKRFQTACRVLSPERLRRLTIHHGRHTFISHALAGGRTLAEVRDAAGHSNVSVTSVYLHVTADDAALGELFG